jgi:hypothetical protein
MNETKIVNVGHFVVLNLKNRLKEFRNLVVQQGNAQILNELDKLIDYAENEAKPLKDQKSTVSEIIIAFIAVFGIVLTPWVYGCYAFIQKII